jgi:hypothetical protein
MEKVRMRGLLVLVVVMGLLIVAGVVTIGVTIMHRMSGGGAAAEVVLDEPAGTRIVGISPDGNRLAVLLSGGGPDRVVILGPGGAVAGRVALKQ